MDASERFRFKKGQRLVLPKDTGTEVNGELIHKGVTVTFVRYSERCDAISLNFRKLIVVETPVGERTINQNAFHVWNGKRWVWRV